MRQSTRVPLAICLVIIAALLAAAPADAAFPGQNGRIAFTRLLQSNSAIDIYSAEPSGAGLARLTSDGTSDNPVFSPDGARLAFTSGGKVYIADQYAGDRELVLDIGVGAFGMDWSPDGTQLVAAFPNCAEFDCESDVYVFGTDGSGLTNLTSSLLSEQNPAWSPDGSKIAFDSSSVGGPQDVYTMNPDGSGGLNITGDLDAGAAAPDWSPDASKVAFQVSSLTYVANPDGTARVPEFAGGEPAWSPDGTRFAYTGPPKNLNCCTVVRVTGTETGFHGPLGFGRNADWQVRQPEPVPPAGGTGYPRPKGATPLVVPLVLNYNECRGAGTMQHGPPLAYPSCEPARTGLPVTVGTPDANGLPAEATGSVRFSTVVGIPATPADEADVLIRVRQEDLRNTYGNNPPYSDYHGSLVLFVNLRVTDLWNAGGAPDGSGTAVDFPLRAAAPCVTTAGPEGGACSLETTVDALTPGLVRERARTIWELGQVLVHYAGGDGNPHTLEDNRPLLAQGLFVP